MNLADQLLSRSYLNISNSTKPISLIARSLPGSGLDTGDGETVKTDTDPALRDHKVSVSRYLLCAQPHTLTQGVLNNH